jgi:hypothetical protein
MTPYDKPVADLRIPLRESGEAESAKHLILLRFVRIYWGK